jgi:hypothetical protein
MGSKRESARTNDRLQQIVILPSGFKLKQYMRLVKRPIVTNMAARTAVQVSPKINRAVV